MIRAVYFDWNGTLFADTQPVVDAVNGVLETFGKPHISMQQYREIFDVPVIKIYRALGFTEDEMSQNSDKIQQTFYDHYEPRVTKTRLRSGARHVLNWLLNEGVDMVLLSNHTKSGIEFQLDRLGIDHFFSFHSGNEYGGTVVHKRTKFDKMKEHMQRHSIAGKESIIIGDSPEEIHMGRDVGAITVAITGGFCSTARLKTEKPDYLITNLLQLINILERMKK